MPLNVSEKLVRAARSLRDGVEELSFDPPVTHVYNPLVYAWNSHRAYLAKSGPGRKKVLFLGMNPGPFGMAQTGVPFGEVRAVRDWMKIAVPVEKPPREHARRPILGLECLRSEVSGRRLWGLFARRFGSAEEFFEGHFVANYCPLVFLEASGCNRTPDKLPARDQAPLTERCDEHLRRLVEILQPDWLIGIGRFATERGRAVIGEDSLRIGTILHPSPASPAANRDWEGTVTRQLQLLGVWK